METITLTPPPESHGVRIDTYLSEAQIPQIPTRTAAQKLITAGQITLANAPAKTLSKNYRISPGDTILCNLPTPIPYEATPEDIPLDILYEDDHLLIINKPRNMVVHPAAGNYSGTLVNALLHHCGSTLSGIGGVQRPGIVHRLDKDTSGLMVVAKNDMAHQSLSTQLAERTMGRIYHAICIGRLKQDTFTIDLPIGRHPGDRKKMAAFPKNSPKAQQARTATTHIEILEPLGQFTLVKATLETGRTHQIRVHLAHMNYPVLGDTTYGVSRQPFKLDGQMLHAKKIHFTHPVNGECMAFESPLPQYFENVLAKIKKMQSP